MKNQLHNEKSAYLLQHKDNPVAWWSWGPEAILKAREENKPIFLSVGYSSCHWCHVMAHESFENKEIADFLNQNYICIKVDREEYPDLDAYYQQACQLFNRSGGWPLSAFLLPDLRPYYVGTYFPARPKNNMTGFLEILNELKRVFTDERPKAEENANKVSEAIKQGLVPKDRVQYEGHFPHPMAILEAVKQFQDNENGGYGLAPKFPTFSFYEWALEQMMEGLVDKTFGDHIIQSLERMLMGGIYDHARGGLHRYSTDKEWLVPHFEKMLYDQAGLIKVLAKLSLIYPSPLVYDCLAQTLNYLEAEMFSEEGHFFTAQDADSEGVEGLYFSFTEAEFEDALNQHDDEAESLSKNMERIKKWFGISANGNFEHGLNVISLKNDFKKDIFTPENWEIVRKVRKALLEARRDRVPPMTDPKGIASWNFMLLSSLVDVMQYCRIDSIRDMAHRLFSKGIEGVKKHFMIENAEGKIRFRHTTTREESLPYLEDYVFFAELMLRTYEISAQSVYKENFEKAMAYIQTEFVLEDKIFTRGLSTNELELYPNMELNSFDSSYRSPASTLLNLVRRGAVLLKDHELIEKTSAWRTEMIHECLKNPISSGEALRALSYPDEVMRSLTIPSSWAKNSRFLNIIPYFQTRFVFDYHNEAEESWEICNMKACEMKGLGIEEFTKTLMGQKEEAKEQP